MRIYDATQGVAGPHCTLLLALQGAEVIKVEPPGGDWLRKLGVSMGDHSAHSLYLNRSKQSIVLDLADALARKTARRLALQCDVVIESFRPGVMARWGLGADSLRADRPDLICASVSGFGQSGPLAQRPAVDGVIQAVAGWMDLNRDASGAPRMFPYYAIDMLTGLYAAQAVLGALLARFRHGVGATLDISLAGSAAAIVAPRLLEHAQAQGQPRALFSSPNGAFRTRDGWFMVSTTTQEQFAAVCRALDRPDIAADARFASRTQRVDERDALDALLAAVFNGFDNARCSAGFEREKAIGAPVQDFSGFMQQSELAHLWLPASPEVPLPMAAIPGMPTQTQFGTAPGLGSHTDTVLAKLAAA